MKALPPSTNRKTGAAVYGNKRGFTLAEVVISLAVVALVLYGVIGSYIQSSVRAEWSGCSLAAQAQAMQQIEQARAAVWDWSLGKNEITNLSLYGWTYNTNTGIGKGYSYTTLDLPISGTNIVVATNYVTLKLLYFNGATVPPVQMQMLSVDTVWPFNMLGRVRYYTNTTATYFGPDNRDASSL